ncbi:MAG: GH1 family beta-glucosidase [Turneriella sp.]
MSTLTAADFGEFLWGAATSAYQIEGAHNADGKEPSIWDAFAHRRRKIKGKDHGDIACDHYHRWPQDVELLAELGLSTYRFSLSWPRLVRADGSANEAGFTYYRNLLRALRAKNIRPFVTLYHWDLPQYLEERGGWVNRDIIRHFTSYTALVVQKLGDLVNDFIVLNEPMIFLTLGYLLGIHAPGKRSIKKFFAASHHALLAQAEAARIIRSVRPDARIGTTISTTAVYPASERPRDRLAAERFDVLYNTFYLDPVVGRGYPTRHFPFLRRIEKFVEAGDMQKLQFDFDFWGINTYTRKVVRYSRITPVIHWRELKNPPGAAANCMNWEVYPEGLYDLLKKFSAYPEIRELMVTENGFAAEDQLVAGRVADAERIGYYREYIGQVLRAKQEGVNVTGYFAWSLLDNFEWAEGYRPRFGLVHVDYLTQKRTIKDSGYWFRDFVRGRAPDKIT